MPSCVKCRKRSPTLIYFSFPDDKEVKKKWIDYLDTDKSRYKNSSKLCSEHFTEDCIALDGDRIYLKDGSVPSIVPKTKSAIKKKTKKGCSKNKKCILCGNNSTDLTYFPIPKIEEIREKWEKFCEFELNGKNYSICHLHFKPSDVQIENGKRKILPSTIPSIYFDDYQFEFIPVARKTSKEDNPNDVECMVVDPAVINSAHQNSQNNQNSGADSIISIDYTEYNTPPRTPTCNNTSSNKTVRNSISDDIVNIFIPSYEDSITDADNAATSDSTVPRVNRSTTENYPSSHTANGRKRRMFYPGDFKHADINSLELAKASIEHFRELINKKNKTIKVLSVKAKRLANRNAVLKETIRQLKAEKTAKEAKEKDNLFEIKGWWDS